jgi:predicted PurR-regulated permease PerM
MVIGGVVLLQRIQDVLILFLMAIIFATAIEPLVDRLRRGPFSRGQGVLIVYTAIFGVFAFIGFFFVPGLVDQLSRFIDTLPQQIASLRPLVDGISFRPLREMLVRAMGEAPNAVERTLAPPATPTQPEMLVAAGGALLHSLFSVVTIFLLAYYWLTERATIKRAVLRLVPPAKAREVNAAWLDVEAKIGGWVRGQITIMMALGVMAGITFLLLGLPNPLLLAVLAGIFEIIPIIGPFLAFVPGLFVALTVDPSKALMLLPIAVVIQQIEGNILVPRIMSRHVGISPLTVIVGILIGSTLYGPAGAFLAVPVAAAIQVILNHALGPSIEEESERVPVPRAELEGDVVPVTEPIASRHLQKARVD